MLVVLRMNRNFMVYTRDDYVFEIKAPQPLNLATVVLDIEEAEGGA